MFINIVLPDGRSLGLDLAPEMEVENAVALIALEGDLDPSDIHLVFQGQSLTKAKNSLQTCGIKDGAVLEARSGPAQAAPATTATSAAPAQIPASMFQGLQALASAFQSGAGKSPLMIQAERDATRALEEYHRNPYYRSIIKQNNPDLAGALESGEVDVVAAILAESKEKQQQQEQAIRDLERAAMLDPFNVDIQRKLEEMIHQKNIQANHEAAVEHMPESFGSVIMLYIDVTVNGVPLKAFVDSGAQMTIMSESCAERCNILRLVDRRYQGLAVGVGTQKIVGRVHMFELKIGGTTMPVSFHILKDQPMDMLLGLDMLKRHQCCINLRTNRLEIGTIDKSVPFLSEADLPEEAKPRKSLPLPGEYSEPLATTSEKSPVSDEAIFSLMQLGNFTREQCVEALAVSEGDPEAAAVYLFNSPQ